MAKYISAVEAAEKAETALKIPLAALVDVFAGIPAADVAAVVAAYDHELCVSCAHELQEWFHGGREENNG